MKLPLTRENIEGIRISLYNESFDPSTYASQDAKTHDLLDQAKLAIDLAERLAAADDLIEEYDRLFGDAYKYGRIKTLTQIYDSLTQEGKRKEAE